MKQKILIVRFSSFGDMIQCMHINLHIKEKFPNATLEWVTKSDFRNFLEVDKNIDKIHCFDKSKGLLGYIKFCFHLKSMGFSHVYDAHNNLRSNILNLILSPRYHEINFIKKSKDRIARLLLFKFRINRLPSPFVGVNAFLAPLNSWGINPDKEASTREFIFDSEFQTKGEDAIVLAPSATWEMKRWPLNYWKTLIHKILRLNHDKKILILGGPDDKFCEELAQIEPSKIENLAGKTSLMQSWAIVSKAKFTLAADTGIIHMSDILNNDGAMLIGPTAFGHPKSQKTISLEIPMHCRPCTKDGRGKCIRSVYQKCMVDLTPEFVFSKIKNFL